MLQLAMCPCHKSEETGCALGRLTCSTPAAGNLRTNLLWFGNVTHGLLWVRLIQALEEVALAAVNSYLLLPCCEFFLIRLR